MTIARHLSIRGMVQGVGFRYALGREARRLGVTGWVRNRRDGSVEALVCGEADAVTTIVAWAHRGPAGASVSDIQVSEADGSFPDFGQRPTL